MSPIVTACGPPVFSAWRFMEFFSGGRLTIVSSGEVMVDQMSYIVGLLTQVATTPW